MIGLFYWCNTESCLLVMLPSSIVPLGQLRSSGRKLSLCTPLKRWRGGACSFNNFPCRIGIVWVTLVLDWKITLIITAGPFGHLLCANGGDILNVCVRGVVVVVVV